VVAKPHCLGAGGWPTYCSCLSSGEAGLPIGENDHRSIQQELCQAQGESHHVRPTIGVYRSFCEDQREGVREGFLYYSV
jgi:hypothetical protein